METTSLEPGNAVIYGLHGRCQIKSIENRSIGNETMKFYHLETTRPSFVRSNRSPSTILIPFQSAPKQGLRPLMSHKEAEKVLKMLSNRESYLDLNLSWVKVHPLLEKLILKEGGLGLGKALSYMHLFQQKHVTSNSEVTHFYQQLRKLLIRELSEVLEKPMRMIESEMEDALRHKVYAEE